MQYEIRAVRDGTCEILMLETEPREDVVELALHISRAVRNEIRLYASGALVAVMQRGEMHIPPQGAPPERRPSPPAG